MENCVKSRRPIFSCEIVTPIGKLILRSCADGFHSIKSPPAERSILQNSALQNDNRTSYSKDADSSLILAPSDDHNKLGFKEARANLDTQAAWVNNYFQNPTAQDVNIKFSDFCFDASVTEFEVSVWKGLFETVKFGQTATYSKLAQAINNQKATRAVGTALKKNPTLLMIPCHRIIRSDGTLGNFAGGDWNCCKEYLLNHERGALTSKQPETQVG